MEEAAVFLVRNGWSVRRSLEKSVQERPETVVSHRHCLLPSCISRRHQQSDWIELRQTWTGIFFKRNLRFSCVLYCRPNVWCSLLFLRFRWRLRVQAPPVAQASGRSYHEPDLASVVRSYKFERTFLIVRATRPTTAVFPFVLLLSLCLISCENFFQAPFFESRLFPAWGKPQLARTSQRNVTFES